MPASRARTAMLGAVGVAVAPQLAHHPAALPALRACGAAQLTRVVEALAPSLVALPPRSMRSVDTPEALAAAERELTA